MQRKPTPHEQRKLICETVIELTHPDLVDVFRFLQARLPKGMAFSEHGGGCSINLDKLSDELIGQLYTFVESKTVAEEDEPIIGE